MVLIHAHVPGIVAAAVVGPCTDCHTGAFRAQADGITTLVALVFPVNVTAFHGPCTSTVNFVHAHVPGTSAAAVVVPGPDRNNVAVRTQADGIATPVALGFPFNVFAFLDPCTIVPFVHSDVPGKCARGACVSVRSNRHNVAVRAQADGCATKISRGFPVKVIAFLAPCTIVP